MESDSIILKSVLTSWI